MWLEGSECVCGCGCKEVCHNLPLVSALFCSSIPTFCSFKFFSFRSLIIIIIQWVDSISRDEPDAPLTQYITNAGISPARYIHYHAF